MIDFAFARLPACHFSALNGLPFSLRAQIPGTSGFNIFTICSRLSGWPFYQFYHFTNLPFYRACWFYHLPFGSIFGPVSFNILPFLSPLPVYHFTISYQFFSILATCWFYHFVRIDSRPCRR